MKKESSSPIPEVFTQPGLLNHSRAVLNSARKLNLQIALSLPTRKADYSRVRQNIADLKSNLQELEAYLSIQEENSSP